MNKWAKCKNDKPRHKNVLSYNPVSKITIAKKGVFEEKAMINKNHTSEIRTCERIKFDQALYILTMYEKKIRKNRQHMYKKSHQDKGVDADE
jgi:hypothetical protein